MQRMFTVRAVCLRRGAGARWKSDIGFIGLGNMGANMAAHLVNAFEGRKLVVSDTTRAHASALEEKGAVWEEAPEAVAERCSTIITMLPSGPVVDSVYAKMFPKIQDGTVLLDASTIGPVAARSIAEKVAGLNKGITFCDAPVSGGVPAATAGTLTFMVGAASDEAFDVALRYLQLMGKNVVRCGPVAAGQTVKVANNLLLASSMVAVSEAMLIGTKLGCDPKTLAKVLNTSTGRCWSSDTYNPYPGAVEGAIPSANDYKGGFACDLMKKDLGLACEAAEAAKVSLTVGGAATKFYGDMSSAGMGGLDFSGALKFIDEKLQK